MDSDERNASLLRQNQNELKLSVNRLERFFIWLSGSSPKTLATCPDSEQRKHAALGGAVLIPTLFSVIASSLLLHTLEFSMFSIALASTLWAVIVIMMDRALLSTYRKRISPWNKCGQLFLRFSIAFLISVTIAHPVVLLLFKQSIEDVYNEQHREKNLNKLYGEKCSIQNTTSEMYVKMDNIAKKEGTLKNIEEVQPNSCTSISPEKPNDNSGGYGLIKTMLDQKGVLLTQRRDATLNRDRANERAIDEARGVKKPGRTGIKNCGTQCVEAQADRDQAVQEIHSLDTRIGALNTQIAQQETQEKNFLAQERAQSEQRREQCKSDQVSSDAERKTKVSAMHTDIARDRQDIANLQTQCGDDERKIKGQQPDILTKALILHGILGKEAGYEGKFIFATFMLLFVLVDMLAVILKFSSSGIYDSRIDGELIDFIEKRQKTVMQFLRLESIERQSVHNLDNEALKHKLEDALGLLVDSFIRDDWKKQEAFFDRDSKKG